MPRSVDLTVDSPASVEQILSAFGDAAYWHARLAEFSVGTATLDALSIDEAGTVGVTVKLGLLRDRLPKVVTQLTSGDLQMVRDETWSWTDGGRVRGDIAVAVPGAPVSAIGQALLVPEADGSRLSYTATVKVTVPLVGGKIEGYMCGQTVEEIIKLQGFTNEWIAQSA